MSEKQIPQVGVLQQIKKVDDKEVDHESMQVTSANGAHGLRFNKVSARLEFYNEDTETWDEVPPWN